MGKGIVCGRFLSMENESVTMVNITHKNATLRKAIAQAVLQVSSEQTIAAIREKRIPKGDVFEFSRAAGLLAVKKTSDVIPDCHPLPVEYTAIRHTIEGLTIVIEVEVHCIYRTGVEVEAMHGAAITALTMYDMLKPIDKAVAIGSIRLLSKQGGKSGNKVNAQDIKTAVLVCSDTVSAGESADVSGPLAEQRLKELGLDVMLREALPDEADRIQARVRALVTAGTDLIVLSGGTGVSPRDKTPEAIAPLIDTPLEGVMETLRRYGQERMPFAMLSRGVAGFSGNSLIITLPGSPAAVQEAMDALFPQVLHVFKVRKGERH